MYPKETPNKVSDENEMNKDLELNKSTPLSDLKSLLPLNLVPAVGGETGLAGKVTTALSLQKATNAEIIPPVTEVGEYDNSSSGRHTLKDGLSPVDSTWGCEDEGALVDSFIHEDNRTEENTSFVENELQDIIERLKFHEFNGCPSHPHKNPEDPPRLDFPFFLTSDLQKTGEIVDRLIKVTKTDNEELFHSKLKHFFILSTAGKPIYSLHGSDSVIMGYMGIITTIVASFEEILDDEIKSLSIGKDVKVMIKVKEPLIFVAMSKLNYESSFGDDSMQILSKQMKLLSTYITAVLSEQTILKSFYNRMNYNLRNILSPVDFKNLDNLAMSVTYGLPADEGLDNEHTFDYFLSFLLCTPLKSIKLKYRTRQKLTKILHSAKKLTGPPQSEDTIENSLPNPIRYADDLLFAFISTLQGNVLVQAKPKSHELSADDVKMLFTMIKSSMSELSNSQTEEMWAPICMPDFNCNGFLYAYSKAIKLEIDSNGDQEGIPLLITLIGANKHSFFNLRSLSNYIRNSIILNQSLLMELYYQLTNGRINISKEIGVKKIKHFIMKSKKFGEYIMSDPSYYIKRKDAVSVIQTTFFYSSLHHTKTNMKAYQNSAEKKLTYERWKLPDHYITGFYFGEEGYDFYCLSDETINSSELIESSLQIIKWAKKYEQRLFRGMSVVF